MINKGKDIPIHLERIIHRSILDLYFKVEEPISVGMYNEGNIRKIVVLPTKNRYMPFIPAESVKGTMRSLARKIYDSSCNKGEHSRDTINQLDESKIEELSKLGIFTSNQLDELNKDDKLNLYLALRCPICRLFGSRMLCGKLLFSDMLVSDTQIITYTSVSINRKRRIAEKERLFTTEYIMPSSTSIRIIANNVIEKQEHELLTALLTIIADKGIQIGGLKSRGYGSLKLDKERSSITILEFIESPKNDEDIINNVRALLQTGNYKRLTIGEYIDAVNKNVLSY
ncbi:MAG: RAMP superfamily CRISPR-associated protein [Candidatus Nitrosocaldaceae archaeon]